MSARCSTAGCRFAPWQALPQCVGCAAKAGDASARSELRRRGQAGRAARDAAQADRGRSRKSRKRDFAPRRRTPPLAEPAEVGTWLVQHMPRAVGAVFLAVVRAIYGATLEPSDQRALTSVVQFRGAPRPGGYLEALLVAGRRAGKSSGAAAIALYEAVVMGEHHMRFIPAGTRGHILIVSRTIKQSGEVFRYARAMADQHFAHLVEHVIESQTGGELHFTNGVVISVGVASSSSLRGFTVLFAIIDEAEFLGGAEAESERDLEEILSTLRMSQLAPRGAPPRRLLVITSPGTRQGYVWETGQRHGKDAHAPVLVAHGASYVWNESLDPEQLERERLRDPRRYRREVLAEFVDAINPLFDGECIERSYVGRVAEAMPFGLLPSGAIVYAAVDIGVRRDSTALTLCYLEAGDGLPRIVVLGCWRWSPQPGKPLDVSHVVAEIVGVLESYGCSQLIADQFSFDAVRALFEKHGVDLVQHAWTQPSKLQRFGVLRDLLVDGRLSLPAHERLIAELRSLDETILPSGTIRIAARGRQHDDCAFACALAVSEAVLNRRERSGYEGWCAMEDDCDPITGEPEWYVHRG